jgi:hypothetical protein
MNNINSDLYIIMESSVHSIPKNIHQNKDKIRMEVVLQTVGDFNINRRRYSRDLIQESLDRTVKPNISTGSLMGELDHPMDSANPGRQMVVKYKDSSHKFLEVGWDGNKLVGVVETLAATENGRVLRDLVIKDNIPVGFSYRGMGELREVSEGDIRGYDVCGKLTTVTWDSVSMPSHSGARLIKINESVATSIEENAKAFLNECSCENITETNGMICTSNGVCYLPDAFDMIVERYKNKLRNKYRI